MGSAPLAQQARSAAAQRERILGRALATTKKIGGRDVSRLAIWRTDAAQEQGIHDGRRAFTGAGHRREYGVIQRGGCCAATDLAGRRAGAVGVVRMAGRTLVQNEWHERHVVQAGAVSL